MILVTGAAGKTGLAVIRALAQKGKPVRALVRRPEQAEAVTNIGSQDVVLGDLGDRSSIERAVDGAAAIYHICPNVDPGEITYAELLIEAAVSAKISQFGYHSVLHPQTEQMVHHWKKLRVEELLFASGLHFTIIQPCAYMQNVFALKESIQKSGVIEVPYSTRAKLSLVDLEDVAAAVATVMTEFGHNEAIYELAGPEALTYKQIAENLQAIQGTPVMARQIDGTEWADRARRDGLGDYQVEALTAMFAYYDQFGFCGNPNALSFILGRQPNSFSAVARREWSVDYA